MSNIIIAIMAVGLIAALALTSLNFSGSIYLEARADAEAVALVAQAKKVAEGMRSWSRVNNSRTFTDTDWSDGTATDLISSSNMYIDALPKLGAGLQGNGASDYYFKALTLSNVAWASEGQNFDILFAVVTNDTLCKAISRLSRGASAVPVYRAVAGATMGSFTSNMASSDFDCVVNDANSNSAIDSGESMFFIYKVF